MSGKGDRDRTTDMDAYGKAYDLIFNEKTFNELFKPQEPFRNDTKKHEGVFYGGKNSNEGVFTGGSLDSIQENTSEDVGANPTSSTKLIPDKPSTNDDTPSGIKLQATRHDIRRIIS